MKELYSLLMAESVNEFVAELRILSKLHHRNVVPFYGLYRALPPGSNNNGGGGDSADRHHHHRYLLVTKFAVRDVLCLLLLLLCECSHGVCVFVTGRWSSGYTHGRTRRAAQALSCARARACASDPQIRLRASQHCWSTKQLPAVWRR